MAVVVVVVVVGSTALVAAFSFFQTLLLLKDLDSDMERLVGDAAREAPSLFYYTQYDLDKSVQM